MNKEVFHKTVCGFSKFSEKSKIEFPDPSHFSLNDITRGILFIYAGWSGSSVHAWKVLTAALNPLVAEDFRIYVIDADELPERLVDRELKPPPHGNGETYWILDGRILDFNSKYGVEFSDKIYSTAKSMFFM